jgi:hypothetical protein
MSSPLPQSDVSRFARIDPAFIVKAYVFCATQSPSTTGLKQRIRSLLRADVIAPLVAELVSAGDLVEERGKLALTPASEMALRATLKSDAGKSWDVIRDHRLPALALRLDPDHAETRQKLTRVAVLRVAILCVAYDLPRESLLSSTAVRSELVWRILRETLPHIVGRGPFPLIDKPNAVDRRIFAGLAGVRTNTTSVAFAALAAKTVGAARTDRNVLCHHLIRSALQRAEPPDGFAQRVKTIARGLNTPPFQGRVAIAQIYDAYGREFPDAGSLESFKHRLVSSAKAGELHLSRLDLPEHMDRELRTRSATPSGSDEVHFVVTDSV